MIDILLESVLVKVSDASAGYIGFGGLTFVTKRVVKQLLLPLLGSQAIRLGMLIGTTSEEED